MTTRITKRNVCADPRGADYFLWDSDLVGFGLRVRTMLEELRGSLQKWSWAQGAPTPSQDRAGWQSDAR